MEIEEVEDHLTEDHEDFNRYSNLHALRGARGVERIYIVEFVSSFF